MITANLKTTNLNKRNAFKKTFFCLLCAAISLSIMGWLIYNSGSPKHRPPVTSWPAATIRLAERDIKVAVADTPARQIEGWSNKKDMGKFGGMIFIFPESARHVMVMRDMLFPLDIVWLSGPRVIGTAESLASEYGRSEGDLTRYGEGYLSTGVVELPAGFIKNYRVKVGDIVSLY